jgi:hypothetical protein
MVSEKQCVFRYIFHPLLEEGISKCIWSDEISE